MEHKQKYYLGLYLFLQHENLLSMTLDSDFRKALMRNFNLTDSELESSLEEVREELDLDISCLYLDFK